MNHISDFLRNGEDPQELWAYNHLGLCDYLPHLMHSGREKEGKTDIVYLVTKYFSGKLLSQYIEEKGQLTQGEAQAIESVYYAEILRIMEASKCISREYNNEEKRIKAEKNKKRK